MYCWSLNIEWEKNFWINILRNSIRKDDLNCLFEQLHSRLPNQSAEWLVPASLRWCARFYWQVSAFKQLWTYDETHYETNYELTWNSRFALRKRKLIQLPLCLYRGFFYFASLSYLQKSKLSCRNATTRTNLSKESVLFYDRKS